MKWISPAATTILILVLSVLIPALLQAKTVNVRKTQEVNFSEMSLKGTIRNPDGAYLVQKRGLKFQPLYKVQEDFDKKLRETYLYVD
jgi:predicted Holliday junction resolvase-like endonuclease